MEKGDEESMSGVYIKGMEMPETCYECPCGDNEFYQCCATKERFSYHRDEYGYPDGERQDWCPLISVPDHGRLIDERWLKDAMITTLEALKKNPKMDRQEMHLIAAFDTLRVMLEDAPTIIPAEEGE